MTIWGFFSLPSKSGKTWHVVTSDPGTVSDAALLDNINLVMEGANEPQMVYIFLETGRAMMDEIVANIRANVTLAPGPLSLLDAVDLWREGYRGSASWSEFVLRNAIRKLSVPPI